MQEHHEEFDVTESGLVLNLDWPHLGASPDGVVNCACCGKGVVEVKCPYCRRFDDVQSIAAERQSCLVESDGSLHLDKAHAYYYQVQTQMFMCKVEYCDFCMCTFPKETSEPSMHIERITADSTFWDKCVDASSHFFQTCILPELLGKWYTRPWFHLTCLNINRVPKGKWYCPDCQKLPEFNRSKKRKIDVEE